jgi:hypothetical protein
MPVVFYEVVVVGISLSSHSAAVRALGPHAPRPQASNRWRTLLVLQELEDEVRGLAKAHTVRAELKALLSRKVGGLIL